jgi:lipoate-protein ligase A
MLSADYKAPGGKLLRVRMTVSTHVTPPVITSFRLTGDFFMHPEDALLDLEDDLVGAPLDATALRERVQAFFDTEVQVVGAAVEDIVHVILAAEATGDQ